MVARMLLLLTSIGVYGTLAALRSPGGVLTSIALVALLTFAAIVAHELAHAAAAQMVGARVHAIVAFPVRLRFRPRRIEPLPMGVPVQESTADAVLLIGDRAMKVPDAPFHAVVDLAEAWHAMTGLPFVFALWVVRAGVDLDGLPEALARSRAEGLAHARELAQTCGPGLGLDFATCYDYLTRALSYDLGEPEIAGLRLFARSAAGLHLAPEGVDLVFHRRRDLAARR